MFSQIFQNTYIGYESGMSGLTCGGDSGSPLVVYDSINEKYTQIGIVSGGQCASLKSPAVFVRIEEPGILKFIYRTAFNLDVPDTELNR